LNGLLEWTHGKSAVEGVSIEQIAAGCGTPLYIYSERGLRRQFAALRNALPREIDIFYSIKSNPHPKVAGVFVQQGAGCEIASGGEYALAIHAGAVPERIVFAGPGKGRDELEYVVAHGIGEIHVESFEELEMLEQIGSALNQRIAVALRVNPSAGSGGGLMMGGAPTAFGFEEESLTRAVERLASCKHLKLCGVHVYTGTQILSADGLLQHWHHAVEVAKKTAALTGGPIATIDLGGGLGIPYFAHETELDLEVLGAGAKRLVEEARLDPRLAKAQFVVEPGRFLSGPAGIYIARVRSVKTCRGTTFVVLDGGMNHHLAASGNLGQVIRRDYPIVNLSQPQSDAESTVVVVGPLCTPIDTLGRKVTLASPRTGDLLGIMQSGAYGLTASPTRFLSHPTPAEVLVNNGKFEVITPRQEFFVNAGRGGCATA